MKSKQIYRCPSDYSRIAGKSIISYGYNSNIAGTPHSNRFTATSKTVMLFEVSDGRIKNFNDDEGVTVGTTTDGTAVSPSGNGAAAVIQSCTYGCNGSPDYSTSPAIDAATYTTGLMGGRAQFNWCYLGAGGSGPCFPSTEGLHLAGANFLMADGHVKWFLGDNVSSGGNASSSTSAQTSGGSAAGTSNEAFQVTFSVR
jgi:prepilin-type processing-associated H-X9-DG protein